MHSYKMISIALVAFAAFISQCSSSVTTLALSSPVVAPYASSYSAHTVNHAITPGVAAYSAAVPATYSAIPTAYSAYHAVPAAYSALPAAAYPAGPPAVPAAAYSALPAAYSALPAPYSAPVPYPYAAAYTLV